MNWASGELRATGDPKDIAYADMLAAIVEARGADIPLPEANGEEIHSVCAPVAPARLVVTKSTASTGAWPSDCPPTRSRHCHIRYGSVFQE